MNARPAMWRTSASALADLLGEAAETMLASPLRDHCVVRLPARGRLLATGDIHDHPIHFDAVVRAARLDRSPDHHVVLHELIHGDRLVNDMDMSHRMLARVAELVLAYPRQVHPILANHEIAQYRRHHISKGAGDNLELFDAGLEWVYGEEADIAADGIGRFVRAMPLAVLCENGVMVSHSIPAPGLIGHVDLNMFARDLRDDDFEGPAGAAYAMTWGRGQTAESVARLAEAWGVKLFVCGHAHAPTGAEAVAPGMVVLNTDHPQGRVLEIDLAAPAPDAKAAVNAAMPIQSYIDIEALGGYA